MMKLGLDSLFDTDWRLTDFKGVLQEIGCQFGAITYCEKD
jgi:hypothetical protein